MREPDIGANYDGGENGTLATGFVSVALASDEPGREAASFSAGRGRIEGGKFAAGEVNAADICGTLPAALKQSLREILVIAAPQWASHDGGKTRR